MASLFTHAIAGAVIGQAGKPAWRKDWRFWSVVIVFSLLPDIDSIGFHLGVPYGAFWGHRGMTHSLLFALVLATLAAMWLDGRFHRQWEMAILFFLVMASHGVLDAMTNGGLGVAFFASGYATLFSSMAAGSGFSHRSARLFQRAGPKNFG